MREDFKMWKLHRGLLVNMKSLATLKSMLEIVTIKAFNQHDPEQKSIVAIK